MSKNTELTPRNPEQAKQAAMLRSKGKTWKEIANIVGTTSPTLVAWSKTTWWAQYMQTFQNHEIEENVLRARSVVFKAIEEGDVRTARWFLKHYDLTIPGNEGGQNITKLSSSPLEDFDEAELLEALNDYEEHALIEITGSQGTDEEG